MLTIIMITSAVLVLLIQIMMDVIGISTSEEKRVTSDKNRLFQHIRTY